MDTVWPRLVIRIAFKHSKVAIFHEEFEACPVFKTIRLSVDIAKPES